MPAVRAGQRPVLARNDPLNIFGRQRQQTLLIAAAECRKKILHNLDILFDAHRNLSFSLTSSVSDLIGRFGTIRLEPNHTVVDRLLPLLEQILEDEPTPSAAACVHQRATLVELSSLTGANPSSLAKSATGAMASSSSLDRKTTRWPPSTIGSVARMAATRWLKPFTTLAPVKDFATKA